MPACTRGARSSSATCPPTPISPTWPAASTRCAGPTIAVRDAAVGRRPTSTPGSRPRWRHYRYHVWNDPAPNPLLARTCVARPAAARPVGDAGRRRPADRRARLRLVLPQPKVADGEPPPSLVRRSCSTSSGTQLDDTPMLRFEIRATAFCHQMVRSHRRHDGRRRARSPARPATCTAILRAGDRSVAGQVAPPHGPRAVGGRLRRRHAGRRARYESEPATRRSSLRRTGEPAQSDTVAVGADRPVSLPGSRASRSRRIGGVPPRRPRQDQK